MDPFLCPLASFSASGYLLSLYPPRASLDGLILRGAISSGWDGHGALTCWGQTKGREDYAYCKCTGQSETQQFGEERGRERGMCFRTLPRHQEVAWLFLVRCPNTVGQWLLFPLTQSGTNVTCDSQGNETLCHQHASWVLAGSICALDVPTVHQHLWAFPLQWRVRGRGW